MIQQITTLIEARPQEGFVETPHVKRITERALSFLEAGFPIHFRGASGTGKTSLAMHVAYKVSRPVVLIHGDEEFSTSDLVGGEHGYRLRKVIDNFIHSVLKTEEDMVRRWVDDRLTVACKYGFTLIYDEYTRSRPEANNVLLSVLEEKLMDLPASRGGDIYLQVDPRFTAIFTSNPEEYAGVHRSQDALRDRMITLDLGHFDEETEVAITEARSGRARPEVEKIVRLVRAFRETGECECAPTVRTCIMLAKAAQVSNAKIKSDGGLFRELCTDILASQTTRGGASAHNSKVKALIAELVDRHWGSDGHTRKPRTGRKQKARVQANA